MDIDGFIYDKFHKITGRYCNEHELQAIKDYIFRETNIHQDNEKLETMHQEYLSYNMDLSLRIFTVIKDIINQS